MAKSKKRRIQSAILASYAQMSKVQPRVQEAVDYRAKKIPVLKSPMERARMLVKLNTAFTELKTSADRPGVLRAPRDQFASILQSTFADMAAKAGRIDTIKALGTQEAKFDRQDPGWVKVAWEKFKAAIAGRIGFIKPSKITRIAANSRIALFGDWATGLYGAPSIGKAIQNDSKKDDPIHVVLHLGDTYYSGTSDEFDERFVPYWPNVPKAIHRALNGNHEMYSGGQAFLKTIQSQFGQNSTAFHLENDHWILLGLDTALKDHDLASDQIKWLKDAMKNADGRKVILFSHHQPFSLLESQGRSLVRRVTSWLDQGRIFAWYWGHEHRCVLYNKHPKWKMWGRCVGHGGIPEFRETSCGACPRKATWYQFGSTRNAPACELLDGPNDFLSPYQKEYSPHGYAILTLDGARLVEEYRDATGTVIRAAAQLK